ncbi:MAG TPA: hypothetical protein VMI54_01330 [Polyangiaceae bacterium]|nr:hypothetical protein [Polyangiaceae bacterium]
MRALGLTPLVIALAVGPAACGSNGHVDRAGASGNAGTAGTNAGTTASGGTAGTNADTAGSGGTGAVGGTSGEAGAAPFEHPTPPTDYVATDHCGLDAPAFCETFEDGPRDGGRSGELDPARFSVARGMPYNPSDLGGAFGIGPAIIGACRANLADTRVLPDGDVLVCDPVPSIPTRHALATTAAQNYGLSTYRIRQPFDFADRTGTIALDVDLTNQGLGGWPALIVAEDPSPAPSFDWQERGSGPRNGIEIEFGSGWCNTPQTMEPSVYLFQDYLQTAFVASSDCSTPHVLTAPDSLNHVVVYLTRSHVEVWASDVSADGVTFPNLELLWSADVTLPFSRGYVSLALRNHATMKYWYGSAATVRFDNFGFDGPKVSGHREYSAPDSLSDSSLPGCAPDGGACEWEGDVIVSHPDDAGRMACAATTCDFEGATGRNVGYVVPNVDEDAPPVALDFSGVDPTGSTQARLVLAAVYPAFDWNGVSHPPTYIDLRFRVNGGAWHDRYVSDAEANAFIDFSPDLGGAGAGAGLLNQAIDLDVAELVAGDNLIELQAANTWTGSYRVAVTSADLTLDP